MKTRMVRSVLLAACCCMMAACQQTSVPPEVAKNLESVRGEMKLGRATIIDTGESVKLLKDAKPADLQRLFASFDGKLKVLEEKAGGVRMVTEMAADRSTSYFDKWEKQVNELADADTRSRASARRTEALAGYQAVKDRLVTLRGSFRLYMASLKDSQKVLASDLTPGGLNAAKPTMEKALEQQGPVIKDLDAVIAAIDKTQP